MTMIRIKLLAAGVMIATGFGLSVGGGGWSGEAAAQYVPPGSPLKAPPTDPNIDKLKYDLEKAKAELLRAERDAEAKEVQKHYQLRIDLDTAPKYEYEPVPEGGLQVAMFEKKLAEREKNGWAFIGQVTLQKPHEAGTEPKLVFRKKPLENSMWVELYNPALTAPPGVAPPAPKVAKPVDPVAPAAPGSAIPALPFLPNVVRPLGDRTVINDPVTDESARRLDKLRIAELEKLVEELRVKGPQTPKPTLGKCYYRTEDFGNWELPQLLEVLGKVFADEIKAKKFNASFRIEPEPGTFTVNDATPDEIRAVTAWVKKLKK